MRLYCVNDYLEACFWFTAQAEAEKCYERLLDARPQEKSEMLEIVRYRTNRSPTEAMVAALNGEEWADEITTIKRAKPEWT